MCEGGNRTRPLRIGCHLDHDLRAPTRSIFHNQGSTDDGQHGTVKAQAAARFASRLTRSAPHAIIADEDSQGRTLFDGDRQP